MLSFREKATCFPASLFFLCCVRRLYDLIQTLRGVTLGFQELCGYRRQRCLNCPFWRQVILLGPAKNIQKSANHSPLPVSWFLFLNLLWITPNPQAQPFLPFSWADSVFEGRQLAAGLELLKETCHYSIFHKQTSDPYASYRIHPLDHGLCSGAYPESPSAWLNSHHRTSVHSSANS